MKNLKKLTAILLVILMLVSATSCMSDMGKGGNAETFPVAKEETALEDTPNNNDSYGEDTPVNSGSNGNSGGSDKDAPDYKDSVGDKSDNNDSYGEDTTVNSGSNGNSGGSDKDAPDYKDSVGDKSEVDFQEGYEGDIVIGSKYFDGENIANVNNEIHLIYTKNNSFVLNSFNVMGGITGGKQGTGRYTYDADSGIYTLTFDEGDVAYGKMDGAVFMYCNKDGSSIDTVQNRGGDGITEVAIDVREGNTDYGYRDLAKNTNGDEMQRLYRELLDIYEALYGSNTDVAAEGDRYVLARIAISDYELSIDEMVSVWKIFGLENPAYYYYYNTLYVEDSKLVLCVDPLYALASERAKYEADIEAMEEECARLLDGKSTDLLCVMAVHDYIITEINYAYEADGITPEDASWAHNITGVSTQKSGVCETYAKTFQYLCLINGIEAITLSGYGGEPHGWNLAKVNGKWYCFDATWNDTGDNSKLSYDCFGLSFSNMTASHTHDMPTDYGVSYLYDIPTVSNHDIQLVTLYEDGVSKGLFCGIDDTFEHMTNKDADYIVELYNYSDTGPLLLSSPMIKHYIFAENTPDVKSISIEGTYKSFDGGYVVVTPIYLVNTKGFTVDTDFSIKDMEFLNVDFFQFPGLLLENAKLIFTGGCCESEITRIARTENDTSSTIVSDTELTTIYSAVNVHRIEGGISFEGEGRQSHITLRGASKVDEVELSILNLTAFGRSKMEIGKFIGIGEHPTIGFDDVEATIGDIEIEEIAEDISLDMKFGKLEEVSYIEITGQVNGPMNLRIDGQKKMISTDLGGNTLDSWTETVDPFDLEEPFIRINDSINFEDISINFIEWTDNGGYHTDKTELYELDDDGHIVMGDITELADGSIVKGNTLIRYNGSETIPTIPEGITRIAPYAFFNRPSITSVVLPEGITYVGYEAFSRCPNMKSLFLPGTLVEFDASVVNFGSSYDNRTVTYNGTTSQWRYMVMRILAESDTQSLRVSTITCIDGAGMTYSPFSKYQRYSDYMLGEQWFEYASENGNGEVMYVFQYNEYDEADIRYCVFFDDGGTMSSSVSDDGFPFEYEYSAETGIFSVDVNGDECYLKETDIGFVFCDADGNTLAEIPVPLR